MIAVERMKLYETGKLLAFVDFNVGGLVVKGFKLMTGSKGLWLAVPAVQNKKDPAKYDDTVFFKDKPTRATCESLAIAEYNRLKGIPQEEGKSSQARTETGERVETGMRTEGELRS
jgi:DNA-binding cell septation regulator SpoVG